MAPELYVQQIGPRELQVAVTAPPDAYVYCWHLLVPHERTRFSDNDVGLEPGERRVIQVTNDLVPLSPSAVAPDWR